MSVTFFFSPVGRSEAARASGELYAASVLSGMNVHLCQDIKYLLLLIFHISWFLCVFSLLTTAVWAGLT